MKYIGNRIGHSVERARAGTDDTGIFNIAQQHKISYQNEWNNNFSSFNTPAPSNIHKTTSKPATNQRYHLFISGTSTFYIGGTQGLYMNYTVIGGGGGGGNAPGETFPKGGGGGGGGGGFVDGQVWFPPGTYTARVGNGGAGGPTTRGATANNGTPSYISGPANFTTITATGGGAGGSYHGNPENTTLGSDAGDGGSGGGACGSPISVNAGLGNTPPTSPPQGFNGGIRPSSNGPTRKGGAGGGGAGGAGFSSYNGTQYYGENNAGGPGGTGRAYGVVEEDVHANFPVRVGVHYEPSPTLFITGAKKRFCGGGGGGGGGEDLSYSNKGIGVDGGGDGGSSYNSNNTANGTPGTANTGGGGGGAGTSSAPPHPFNVMNTGGNGGSGVIIISYTYQ